MRDVRFEPPLGLTRAALINCSQESRLEAEHMVEAEALRAVGEAMKSGAGLSIRAIVFLLRSFCLEKLSLAPN